MAEVADPEEGLRVESASRLDWDRDRWLRRPLNAVVNPVKADSDFMSRLLFLLRKVSSIQDPYSPVVNCGYSASTDRCSCHLAALFGSA